MLTYIAANNEYECRAICNKYGFNIIDVNSPEDMAECLRQLIAAVGEPAYKDILALHPDTDAILEVYGTSSEQSHDHKDCGCKKKKQSNEVLASIVSSNSSNSNNSQVFIIAAALLLAVRSSLNKTVMEKTIPKKRMDQMLAKVLHEKTDDLRALLSKNGVNASAYSVPDVRRATLKAIKDSETFRKSMADYLSGLVQMNFVDQPQLGFAKQPMLQNIVDQPQLAFTAPVDDVDADPFSTTTVPTSTVGTKTTTSTKSGFWNTLGSVVNKDTLTSLFNTGLNVASTSLQNKANASSEERALELERLRLAQLQQQQINNQTSGKGLSTGAVIGIVVGGLAVIVGIVLLVKKKK